MLISPKQKVKEKFSRQLFIKIIWSILRKSTENLAIRPTLFDQSQISSDRLNISELGCLLYPLHKKESYKCSFLLLWTAKICSVSFFYSFFMSSGFAEVSGLLLNGWVKRSILWLKKGKWGTYILSYIRKSLSLQLILRIRPQIMYREILAGFSEALRKWDPIESWILHSNLNFNLQTTLKKVLASGSWATNVKRNKTVEFHTDEDSITSAEIFPALSLLFS